jgi:hypothetical protein
MSALSAFKGWLDAGGASSQAPAAPDAADAQPGPAVSGDAPDAPPAAAPESDAPVVPTKATADAGSPDAGTTDGGAPDAGAADGAAPDAPADETPVFRATSPAPNDVLADTVDQFASGANAAMGAGGEVGHMEANIQFNPDTDDQGRITRVNMVVDTKIVRPRWAGGRPTTDKEKALIKKAEELIRAHEERHRDIARDFATRAVKAMRGQPGDKAQKVFDKFMKDMDAAQAAFDHREGKLIVDHDANGNATGVRSGPAP